MSTIGPKVWVLVELQESDADLLHGHLVSRPGMSVSGVFELGFMELLESSEVDPDPIPTRTESRVTTDPAAAPLCLKG